MDAGLEEGAVRNEEAMMVQARAMRWTEAPVAVISVLLGGLAAQTALVILARL